MSVDSDIAELNARADAVIDHLLPFRYADALAVGYFADDVESVATTSGEEDASGIVAVVYEGRLFRLSISDAYLDIPPEELSALINGVVINAFGVYQEVYNVLVDQAQDVLDAEGVGGQERIRRAIEDDTPLVG